MQHLVLVGAGHAHVEVLRAFGRRPEPDVRITVITREPTSPYSGMLPGVVAGRYTRTEAEIDIRRLASFAGAELVIGEVTGLDPKRRLVTQGSGATTEYDIVSLDIGSRPNTNGVHGTFEHTIPVKPIDGFFARFEALREKVRAGRSSRIAVVGGGAGGVELMLAVAHRLRADTPERSLAFTLVTAGPDLLPGFPRRFRRRIEAVLASRHIDVRYNARVVALTTDGAVLEGSQTLEADDILWTTQASPAAWLAETGLALDNQGFVQVDENLQAQDGVFAAGDIISFRPRPLPRSGVFAVRAGPVLADNLRASLTGRALRAWRPQRNWLVLLSTSDGSAIATRNGLTCGGPLIFAWKDWIDRRFIARFDLPDKH